MKLEKPSMNYINDLDECLTYSIYLFIFLILEYIFFGLPNLFPQYNEVLGRKVPKLLESYGNMHGLA